MLVRWINENKEKIKTLIVSGFLAFGVFFVGTSIVKQIFIWGQLFNWFGLSSISVQMNFCLHLPVLIFLVTTSTLGFVMDKCLLKDKNSVLSRKIFWIFLSIISVSYIIGHYQSIFVMNYHDEELFEKMRFLICY